MVSEGPGEREFEDWQDFFEEEIYELSRFVTGSEEMPSIKYPPIISRRTKEETDRNKTLFDSGVISLEEWRRRENVDSEKMDEEINGAEEFNQAGKDDWQQDFEGNTVLSQDGKPVRQDDAKEPEKPNK